MNFSDRISDLLTRSADIQSFMDGAVVMVAEELASRVCSIYLYNESTGYLTLRATHGLDAAAVGRVKLKAGEGLVGRAFTEMRPVCVSHASSHPDYRYFSEVGEEGLDSFLVVPLARGVEHIGVLVVQREAERPFNDQDVKKALLITEDLISAVETIRAMFQIEHVAEQQDVSRRDLLIRGHAASPGFALAPSVIFQRRPVEHILKHNRQETNGRGTPSDLRAALAKTTQQLQELQEKLSLKLPEVVSLIFESHMMMLKDQTFTGAMLEKAEAGVPASRAVAEVAIKYIDMFEASSHDYLREKARDVEDLALRLISNLTDGGRSEDVSWQNQVLIVGELFPSDILKITLEEVAGIIKVGGGITSHISILVRSLDIPMVIVQDYSLMRLPDGENILLDAYCGSVYVNPSQEVIDTFMEREKVRETARQQKAEMADVTLTSDDLRVELLANVNLLSELDLVHELKADGIGLYRTEFPFLIRQTLPTEEEQCKVYRRLVDRMSGSPVTIRTLDAGGDKLLAYFDDAGEANPALGLRSTRLTLRYRDVFDHQINAILRAGAHAEDLKIMFPMISSLDELRSARECVEKAHKSLCENDGLCGKLPGVGMMVELPAVLEIIDDFAREADFFSIGTNDFIQYMLAVDRTNERVADYYCPHHPSVLRGIKKIADAAQRHNIQCSVCGEMAHDTRYIPFFIGIGITALSVDPHYLPETQKCIASFSAADAREYAEALLSKSSIKEIEELLWV